MALGGEVLLRRGLLVAGAAALLTGIVAGLGRLGLPIGAAHATAHGPLVVLGAFTTIIALERAVALGRGWALAAPGLGAAGAVGLLGGLPAAEWVSVGASVFLVLVNAAIVRRQSLPFTWLMLLGALLLAVGTLAFAGSRPIFELSLTWVGFFVLTIAAERLELSRLAPTPRWAERALAALSVLLALAALGHLVGAPGAPRLAGGALAAIGLWQLRFDLARHLLRRGGLPRFAATGVLSGAAWLVGGGAILLGHGLPPAGPVYDAALHTVFVGYVLSMVFAHAPIVLPAVARVEVPFVRLLYAPLALLHLGLAARVGGDLLGLAGPRSLGGLASALALAVFAATIVGAKVRSR